MVVFRQKKIIAVKSLGEDLVEAREALNLTLLSVEKKIGIGREYLEAIERGDWQLIPGEVYAMNFLKRYASFLGVDKKRAVDKFQDETGGHEFWPKVNNYKFGIIPQRLLILPKIIKNSLVVLGAVVVFVYLGWQTWSLIKPPSLEILYPAENFITTSGMTKILGKVNNESWVGINGQEVTVDRDGFFTIDINLNKGLNVIKLEARRKHGKSAVVYRRIVAEEKVAVK